MRRAVFAVLVASAFACGAPAGEIPAESRVASIGMFKNGIALVSRIVTVPGPGLYCLNDVPQAVHGTFWIESDAQVEVLTTEREVEVLAAGADLREELAGRKVLIHFRDGRIPPAGGTVIRPEVDGERAWDRTYQRRSDWWGASWRRPMSLNTPGQKPAYLVLETERGRVYVDQSMVAYVQTEGPPAKVTRMRPVMLLSVGEMQQKPATISLTYLTKGIAWAPSYRVDISDPGELRIAQKAVIKNELEDVEDAELYIISGFPSMEFSHVTSPLSLGTSWANFFQQLASRRGRDRASVTTQQMIISNVAIPDMGNDVSAIPEGEGPDVHYQPIGRRSLKEGDSLALGVASANASYERIVEWIVPDTRRADGRYIQEHERRNDPERYQDAAWDALRFRNPLPFAMTTGPAMVVENGRFQGQRTSFWVNKGEMATLHITKALSIRTRSVEHEEEGKREVVWIGGDDHRKTTVKGELVVANHRAETVKIVIRRRFSGDLVRADDDPTCELREEGVYSVNKRNELTWTITLKPGAKKTLAYEYTVLVNC